MFHRAKMIEKPAAVFPEITADFYGIFGSDLISLVLYGSGAGSAYIPGRSDLNFMIVLSEVGLDNLERSLDVVKRWRKRKVVFLFMTKAYIESSMDSYPVEFLNMKLRHVVVYGVDPLEELEFEPCYIKLELERELKGKILHLRHGFLDANGREAGLRELIVLSLGTFMPLFNALLFLLGRGIPPDRRQTVNELSQVCPINAGVFLKCLDIKEGKGKYEAGEVKSLFRSYKEEIAKLIDFVDRAEKI